MKNLLIIEPYMSGHRTIYVSHIAKHYIKLGANVHICSLKGQIITEELRQLCDANNKIHLSLFDPPQTKIKKSGFIFALIHEFQNWLFFRKILKRTKKKSHIDFVFVPYIDYILYVIGFIGSPFGTVSFAGICMRPNFHYPKMEVVAPSGKLDFIKEFIFKRSFANKFLKHLYSIDELLCEYINNQKIGHKKLIYFPDPSDLNLSYTREESRALLGIPHTEKVILVYGVLDGRKGIDLLLNTVEQLTPEKQPAVLLVGKQSYEIRELLKTNLAKKLLINKKLFVINRFIDAKEEGQVFVAADSTWLVYKNHYAMSGVLVKSAQAGVPVISCSNGLIGYYTKKYNLGQIYCENFDIASYFNKHHIYSPINVFSNHHWSISLEKLIYD